MVGRKSIVILLLILLTMQINNANVELDQSEYHGICIDHSSLTYHDHYYLQIFLDGDMIQIEANVGITEDCMLPLHTHDSSGRVHLEFPENYNGTVPTIGDFFIIWGKTLSDTELMGEQKTVTLTYDGGVCNTNVEDYVPSKDELVTISADDNTPSSPIECPSDQITIGTPNGGNNESVEGEDETTTLNLPLPFFGVEILMISLIGLTIIKRNK